MSVRLVEITRGGLVESVHEGNLVVADANGLVAVAGDPETFAYFRSSAKPFQAIPVVESGAADAFALTPAELALCCASHNGAEMHQTQVRAFLEKLGLDESALQCGCPLPGDDEAAARIILGMTPKTPLGCDCSGKHSGMLATCLHLGDPIDSYIQLEHPHQQRIRSVMAEVCQVEPDDFALATDGCSVPTFGAPISAFARAYAELANPVGPHAEALLRLRSAMAAFPENVDGYGGLVTNLMAISDGKIIAKTGAEGMICLAVPDAGLGITIRMADGTYRGHAAAVLSLLRQLDVVDESILKAIEEAHSPEIRNHNGWLVGERRAVFELERTDA